MDFNGLIEKWYGKHTLILNEYNKITSNNEEVKQIYRSQMTQILEFIEDLKQLSNSDSKKTDFLNLSKSNNNLPPKGVDVWGYDSKGEKYHVFRCACSDVNCIEWRDSIIGSSLMVNIVKWEYIK